jgi:tRNA-2-methylthio-N6-dimethylallyladenosine synthase
LYRIRFTTSHPKDLSDDLIDAFKDVEKLCHHIHLPVQSGSNRILKRMNRKYSRERYLKRIEKLRTACPDIAVTTDIIVGFPGEMRQDFRDTLDLIKSVEYDSLFAFKYSDRPNAPAARLFGKIAEYEKKDRLEQVLELHKQISRRRNAALVGSIQTVLVDGHSKRNRSLESIQYTGRTSTNRIVNFADDRAEKASVNLCGCLVPVRIENALTHSLLGKTIASGPAACGVERS